MAAPKTCDECKFWFLQSATDHGECRRYPPVFHALVRNGESEPPDGEFPHYQDVDTAVTSDWPRTEASDWCGEFQAKP